VKAGSLTVVGTGLIGIGQTTPEALASIEGSEKLFHLVVDPVSRAWLEESNPTAESLLDSYAEGRYRPDSYEEMTERILTPVRRGLDVCAAFYGHPGVFVHPSHEAIRRARALGYPARMLPGISSEDCLFADLELDPAARGWQSFEATDFLTRRRAFDPASPLVLWQIGAIGVSTYRNRTLWSEEGLRILAESLAERYSPEHEVVVYEAPRFAISEPVLQRVALARLDRAEVSTSSTLFVPPRNERAPAPPDRAGARGCLTLVGTGYRVAGHMNLETRAAIEQARRLFYLVTDPGTSAYLEELHPDARSLHDCYREGESGRVAFERMVDAVLAEVTEDASVCVAFSGHPAIGLPAAHEMLSRARLRGAAARMLPAVSFEDCLFADLGVDPAVQGHRILDAGRFLEQRPALDPRCGLVLLQAGVIGWTGYREGEAGNPEGLARLGEALVRFYRPQHEAVLYEIADLPFLDPRIETVPIGKLGEAPVSVRSTLYVPPIARCEKDPLIAAMLEAGAGERRVQGPAVSVRDRASIPNPER
jgi:uncharacterized protein YabN with tetrapyrrole methylase and pyrophosphatase domain